MTEPEPIAFRLASPKWFVVLLISTIQHLRIADTHSSNFHSEYLSSRPCDGYDYVHHTEPIGHKYAIYFIEYCLWPFIVFSLSVSVTQCKKPPYAIDVCRINTYPLHCAFHIQIESMIIFCIAPCTLTLVTRHSPLVSEFIMSCYSFNIKISINSYFVHSRSPPCHCPM